MTSLYPPGEADRLMKKARICQRTAYIIALIGLALCVSLCFGLRPNNTTRRLTEVIAVSTAAGWVAILLINVGFRPSRGTARHIEHLAEAEETEYTGILKKDPLLFRIPGSVIVQKIRLSQGEETVTLNIDARKRNLLPETGTPVRVRCRRSFITAFEALHE